jgi:hypothetical protein
MFVVATHASYSDGPRFESQLEASYFDSSFLGFSQSLKEKCYDRTLKEA